MKYISPLDVVLCLGGILFCYAALLFARAYILPLPEATEGAPTYCVDCPIRDSLLYEAAAVGDLVIDAKEKLALGTLRKKELLFDETGNPFLRLTIEGGRLEKEAIWLGNKRRSLGDCLSLRLPLLRIDGRLSGVMA